MVGITELLEENIEGEFIMLKKETGTRVKYCLNSKKISFAGGPATLFLVRDSSDTERAHRRLVEEKYRGLLLSTVTHELKTPLTVISGNLELIERRVPRDAQPCVDAALLAAKSLKYYLRDINVLEVAHRVRT